MFKQLLILISLSSVAYADGKQALIENLERISQSKLEEPHRQLILNNENLILPSAPEVDQIFEKFQPLLGEEKGKKLCYKFCKKDKNGEETCHEICLEL